MLNAGFMKENQSLFSIYRGPSDRDTASKVQSYLDDGADPNILNVFGTPLHAAVALDNTLVIEILLDSGALIDRQECRDGLTPLMYAARAGRVKSSKILLEHGANTLIKSKDGMMAIDLAKDPTIKALLTSSGIE